MAKVVISDGKDSVQVEKDIDSLTNKKIGDVFDGSVFGLPGYELVITGGSDKDGFPMRRDVTGMVRKRLLLTDGAGINAPGKGVRLKKMVRGNVVSKDIAQLNTKVVKKGAKSLKDLLGAEVKPKEEEEKPAKEKPAAPEKKEEPKDEAKPEEKKADAKEEKPPEEKSEKKEEKSEDK